VASARRAPEPVLPAADRQDAAIGCVRVRSSGWLSQPATVFNLDGTNIYMTLRDFCFWRQATEHRSSTFWQQFEIPGNRHADVEGRQRREPGAGFI